MKPPGADPVMTPRDHGAGGARVTFRTQHPEVPAAVVITGAGDNQKGHAAADTAGVPDILGCPGRELAGEQTPALRRPAKRGPARTRCSVHLRPAEHATNHQRVIGDQVPGIWTHRFSVTQSSFAERRLTCYIRLICSPSRLSARLPWLDPDCAICTPVDVLRAWRFCSAWPSYRAGSSAGASSRGESGPSPSTGPRWTVMRPARRCGKTARCWPV